MCGMSHVMNESCALAHDKEWTVFIWRSVHTTNSSSVQLMYSVLEPVKRL
jgi:hypothetical protein